MNSNTIILLFELIGTVAFTISGDMVAFRKKMDIFGVIILGLCPAVGGGIIRDIVLGRTPPNAFQNPIYIVTSIAVSVIVFYRPVRSYIKQAHSPYDKIIGMMDAIGLGIFTVTGVHTALMMPTSHNVILLIFLGTVTGIGGGILRDILAAETPIVFVKHFYATASIIGSVIYIVLRYFMSDFVSLVLGASVVFVLRLLAAKYHWSLPKAD